MSDNFSEQNSKQPSHLAYSVTEGKDDQNHWTKIGAAWQTKGDGLKIKLNAQPLDGEIHLRSRAELERMRAEREQSQSQQQSQDQTQEH